MFEKFGEFDSYEEINRADAAQLDEGDTEAIYTIAKENGLDQEDTEEIAPAQSESEEKKQDIENTKGEVDSEQVEGQIELTRDFPEFCPDSMNLPERPFKSRKEYIDSLTVEGAAVYLAKSMQSLPHFKINFSDFWEEWLVEEVDENGEEIEVVETK